MRSEFKWDELESEELVVEQVQAVAVYLNPKGHVVVRQQADYNRDEDDTIIMPLESAERVANRILALIAEFRSQSK